MNRILTVGMSLGLLVFLEPISRGQENHSGMMKITVTGTKSESTVKDYAGSIDVINKDDYKKNPSKDIRNLLKDVPGVTTRKTTRNGVRGTPGISDVNIRGLDGDRILFLIDGIRLPDRYEYGGYYNIGQSEYVDFSFLKSIDIFKGSLSSLYGAEALGGLIYYRTLEPYDILKSGSSFNAEIPYNYFSEDDGRAISNKMSLKLSNNLSALFVYTNEASKATRTAAPSKYIDEVQNLGSNIMTNIQYDINDESSLNVIIESINRSSRVNASEANLKSMSSTFTNYKKLVSNTLTDRTRVSAKLSYDSADNSGLIRKARSTIYWQDAQKNDNFRRVVEGIDLIKEEDKIYSLTNRLIGFNSEFLSNINLFEEEHNLWYGVDLSENDGSRTRRTKDLTTGSDEVVKDTPDTKTLRSGLYLQDQFKLGKFNINAGLRYDFYFLNAENDLVYNPGEEDYILATDQSYKVLTPKLSISYQPTEESSLYARYSQGFRPPAWYELSSSFANLEFGYLTISNPNLKPERSHDFEIGYKSIGNNYAGNIAAYYNQYSDFMDAFSPAGTNKDGYDVFQTQNVSDAEIHGVELSGIYFLSPRKEGLYISNVFSWSEGNNLTDKVPLETIVPVTNRASVGFQGKNDRWLVSAGMVYSGRPRLSSEYQNTIPYFIPSTSLIFDLEAYWRINKSVSLNASLNNITNERYYNFQDVRGRDGSNKDIVRFSQPERNIQVGAVFAF